MSFQGDAYFNPTNKTIELKIEKEATQINNIAAMLSYGYPGQIIVNLTNGKGKPVCNRTVLIEVDFAGNLTFTSLGSVITDSSGIGTLNYTPWEKPAGYLMNVTFPGDSYYESSFSYSVLVINKELCNLEIESIE